MSQTIHPEASFAKVRLLHGPIYREDGELWEVLERHADEIRHYMWQIGQELVYDPTEGYAFIRQIRGTNDERIPRLVQRRGLSYDATVLLVCLREDLLRLELAATESERLVKTREELHELTAMFFPESLNRVKDEKIVNAAIQKLVDLGFLKHLESGERDVFEVMRIVKARITPTELVQIKERLMAHVQPST
jgi:hypothetical protein